MTITTATSSYHLTEADLIALSLRFVISSKFGIRAFYVDGQQVTEQDYRRAYEEATKPAVD